MKIKTDVLIIGGGPGGATAAMFLLREGIKPIVIEQETFPRFHIGESMTGEAGQVLRRLGLEENMSRANYPVKQGKSLRTGQCEYMVYSRRRAHAGLEADAWGN